MRLGLSIMKCAIASAAWLALAAPAARAELAFRQPGATIGISIANEMVYAMQGAVEWLCASQKPDGSWGGYRETALALFALKSTRQPEATNACAKAAAWLDALASVPTNLPLDAYAWHLMARGPANLHATEVRKAALARVANAALEDRILWREAAENLRPPASAAGKAPSWPPPEGAAMQELWRIARKINFGFGGVLAPPGGEPLNWQEPLARRLVDSQRRAFSGRGSYWPAAGAHSAEEQTAFALLIFLEL